MWEKESELAFEIVKSVAGLITHASPEKAISQKSSPTDLVTSIDLAVEKSCKQMLKSSDFETLGEETYYHGKEIPKAPYWCLDPIDGTLNFISGFPYYGTSLGLYTGQANNGFVAGAISLPCFGEYYYTKNENAYVNEKRLVTPDIPLSESYLIDCFTKGNATSERNNMQYDFFDEYLKTSRGVLRLGSVAAAICLVASGKAGATIGRKCEIWDAAAGIAIAQKSGCVCWYKVPMDSTKIDFIIGSPKATQGLIGNHKLLKFLDH